MFQAGMEAKRHGNREPSSPLAAYPFIDTRIRFPRQLAREATAEEVILNDGRARLARLEPDAPRQLDALLFIEPRLGLCSGSAACATNRRTIERGDDPPLITAGEALEQDLAWISLANRE